MSDRRPREERRNLNAQEAESMGFVEMQELNDDEGWPYDDSDEEGECIYDARGGIWGWEGKGDRRRCWSRNNRLTHLSRYS